VASVVVHPRATERGPVPWQIDLAIVYLTESINLRQRRDVAVAQLGRRNEVGFNDMVSFAGTFWRVGSWPPRRTRRRNARVVRRGWGGSTAAGCPVALDAHTYPPCALPVTVPHLGSLSTRRLGAEDPRRRPDHLVLCPHAHRHARSVRGDAQANWSTSATPVQHHLWFLRVCRRPSSVLRG